MPLLGDLWIFLATGSLLAAVLCYAISWRNSLPVTAGTTRESVTGKDRWLKLGFLFYSAGSIGILLALCTLLYLILNHDYSVAYVFSYSSSDLPIGFLISTLWGGQEGTFLLWAGFTVIMAFFLQKTAKSFERGTMTIVALFILSLLIIMIKKSPFELLPVAQLEGRGLNPLLQNFWMQIHPPIMFLGFAGVVFPFAFAITGLVERRYAEWSAAARRWTMFSWSALGVALILGGYWAYETLGWGGFWAWDPVENSSLIPWLFLTSQVHALFIKQTRKGMLRFSIVAVCLTFWSVLYGTFLTRSGVLADFSVHSFVDLGINAFLVVSLLTFVFLGLALLLWRWQDIRPSPSFSAIASRSYMVTLGVVILAVGAVLVLIGTSAPLFTGWFSQAAAVGQPYYFSTMTPIAIVILALVTVFPAFRWNDGLSKPMLLWTALGSFAATVAVLLITGFTREIPYLLLIGLSFSAIVANGYVLLRSIMDRSMVAGYLSHVGLAIGILGATFSAGFEQKEVIRLDRDVVVTSLGYPMKFIDVVDHEKGFMCHVEVTTPSGPVIAKLDHEFPKNAEGVMKRPYIITNVSHDLYLAPQNLERAESTDPGTLSMQKGSHADIAEYHFDFGGFEMSGSHGENDPHGGSMSAAAMVKVRYGDKTEELRPRLDVVGGTVTPTVVTFDNGRGSVYVAGVSPEDGGVVLKVDGPFLPPVEPAKATLVLEVSRKPWILLFWIGTFTMFVGGIWSLVRSRRKRSVEQNAEVVRVAVTESTSSAQ